MLRHDFGGCNLAVEEIAIVSRVHALLPPPPMWESWSLCHVVAREIRRGSTRPSARVVVERVKLLVLRVGVVVRRACCRQ